MSIRLDINVNVEFYMSRKIDVVMRVDSDVELPPFRFELLLSRPGIRLEDLRVVDTNGLDVNYSLNGRDIKFDSSRFVLSCSVLVDYSDCVGVDRETEFNFPFVNEHEIYFSTGLLPFPVNLHSADLNIELFFHVIGVPVGWRIFSSLDAGELTAAKLDNFFWYANSDQKPKQIILEGNEQSIQFQLFFQRQKNIPISIDEFARFLSSYLLWLESNMAPYRQLKDINCLILQAPHNYLEMTSNSSFATGENVMNGIMAYGPDDRANYQMLGSATYGDYLLEGVAHEIMHFYTTTAVQGKYKSLLYPTWDCPPVHARLIGESMNLYCVYQFVGEYLRDELRLQTQLISQLRRVNNSAHRNGLLDAHILHQFLAKNNSSLLQLLSAMVKRKHDDRGPYSSGHFIFETVREKMGIGVSNEIEELILGVAIPDYNSLIQL